MGLGRWIRLVGSAIASVAWGALGPALVLVLPLADAVAGTLIVSRALRTRLAEPAEAAPPAAIPTASLQ